MRRCNAGALLLLLGLGVSPSAMAAELRVQAGIEHFRWREFDAAGAGILEERGPRIRVGGDWRLLFGEQHQYLFQLRGALYGGNVDYDGQACVLGGACAPYKSDSRYLGLTVETTVARRFGDDAGTELF